MKALEPRVAGVVLLVLSILAGGCELFGSDAPPALSIETDRTTYDLAEDDTIQVTIRNTSDRVIHYSTCLETTLEILEDGRVVDTVGFPVCLCICPAQLAPGERVDPGLSSVRTDTIVEWSDSLRTGPAVSYRLVYAFHWDEALGDEPLPRQERRSNPFNLQLPE